jgi:peptidoglycan hydrolase CwlO-like protein
MSEIEVYHQMQTERDQAVARLRVANGHTEDAFKKLQSAQHEIDTLRGSLSKTFDRLEQVERDWIAEQVASNAKIKRLSIERDEARVWAKRLQREKKHGLHTATSTATFAEGKHE